MTTIRSRLEASLHVAKEQAADLEKRVAAADQRSQDWTVVACAWGLAFGVGIAFRSLAVFSVFGAAFAVALARLVVIRGRLTRLRSDLAHAEGRAEAFEEVLLCRWVEVVRGEGRGKRETKRAGDGGWL